MIDDLDKKLPSERKSKYCSDFRTRVICELELDIKGWWLSDFYNLLINDDNPIHFNQGIFRQAGDT